uniref:TIGR02611 family protein n=1 Tax=Schlesneria paludicola TaxID=360056 RepID=A0A7C4LPW1_9PLAN
MTPADPAPESADTVPIWRGIVGSARKAVVFVSGSTLVSVGFVLVLIPGPPGWPLVLGGVALLATEFSWARSMVRGARARWINRPDAAPNTTVESIAPADD